MLSRLIVCVLACVCVPTFGVASVVDTAQIWSIVLEASITEEMWNATMARMRDAGLSQPIHKYPAINGRKLDIRDSGRVSATTLARIESRGKGAEDGIRNRGALGCYLSHLAMWRKIVAENTPWAMIFEEDVVFTPTFHEYVALLFSTILLLLLLLPLLPPPLLLLLLTLLLLLFLLPLLLPCFLLLRP